MPHTFEGPLTAKGLRVGIVASRWNGFITAKLLEGAVDTLIRHGAAEDQIEGVRGLRLCQLLFGEECVGERGAAQGQNELQV